MIRRIFPNKTTKPVTAIITTTAAAPTTSTTVTTTTIMQHKQQQHHVLSSSSSSSSFNKSFSVATILYYCKNISTILMMIAFVFATIIIPQQQRRLFATILLEGKSQPPSPPEQQQQQQQQPEIISNIIVPDIHSIRNENMTTIKTSVMRTDTMVTADTSEEQDSMAVIELKLPVVASQLPPEQQSLETGHVVLVEIQENENDAVTSITTTTMNNRFGGIVARSFPSWPNGTLLPCYPARLDWKEIQNSPSRRGFLYVKPYKTGSSTTSGVNLRIARNVAKRRIRLNSTICDARFDHGPTYYPGNALFQNRIPNESILWSIIRDPTTRAISQFFHFEVSRKKNEPTDTNLISFLRQNRNSMLQDYYYRALYTKTKFDRDKLSPIRTANNILRTYSFIGITERLDESFVVLMMILRLRMADILYLSAKTKGGYDDGGGRGQQRICTYIWPSFVSPGVKEFLKSPEWQDTIRYDVLLYQAVNRSLDMTIDTLGRHRFNDNLQKYRHAQTVANEKCLPTTIFPCDSGGNYHASTDCIWNDSGCGATCLDDIATQLNLW